MKDTEYYSKKRNKKLDKIIKLRKEYNSCFPRDKGEPSPFRMRGANEIFKYAKTQDPQPSIPQIYLVDLAANIPVHMKIASLVSLIEKAYNITDQEREFLKSIARDYKP